MNDLKNNGFDKSDLQNFKEDYKAVNNLITPKKEVVSKLKSMATISPKPKFKYAWVGGIASALVCAVFLITIAINFNSGDKIQNVDKLKHAENYKEIYRLIDNTIYKENTLDNFIDNLFGGAKKSDMNMTDGAMPESGAITEDMSEDTGAANNDFSDTNVQVKGVQESDIIKTDGEYIYTISKSKISIIKDDKVLSQITHRNKGEQAFEMYIYNDRLVVFYRVGDEPDIPITVHTDISADDIKIVTYDVSDKSAIKEIGAISQSGYYISSRMIDNYVYTVTEFYISWDFKKSNPITYIPKICGEVMDFSLIDLLPNIQSPKFTVVTSFDVNSPDEYSSKRAFLGGADQIYSSTTNMYLAKSKYVDDDYSYNATEVVKLSLTNGIINVEKNATIFGDIINQFAMDENNGYFRVVTNGYFHPNYKKTNDGVSKYNLNNLYILDENLQQVGALEGIAEGEDLKSVRFMGDTVYFVTFRQVDPLFCIDISLPTSPKLISALKIPGFSTYMHPYGKNNLLGLGYDADQETGQTTGIKLSMFDISNKSDIKEYNKFILKDNYSEALYNHKAILVSDNKSIIGLPLQEKFILFGYSKENGFSVLKEIDLGAMTGSNISWRSLYIGNEVFVYRTDSVSSKIDIISLDNYSIEKSIIIE